MTSLLQSLLIRFETGQDYRFPIAGNATAFIQMVAQRGQALHAKLPEEQRGQRGMDLLTLEAAQDLASICAFPEMEDSGVESAVATYTMGFPDSAYNAVQPVERMLWGGATFSAKLYIPPSGAPDDGGDMVELEDGRPLLFIHTQHLSGIIVCFGTFLAEGSKTVFIHADRISEVRPQDLATTPEPSSEGAGDEPPADSAEAEGEEA